MWVVDCVWVDDCVVDCGCGDGLVGCGKCLCVLFGVVCLFVDDLGYCVCYVDWLVLIWLLFVLDVVILVLIGVV